MNKRFIAPDFTDKRIIYASEYLEDKGFIRVEKAENADFVLLGVNPSKEYLNTSVPIFAGNVKADSVFDYTRQEDFAIENAYLTAEGALALAVSESERSLIHSKILILGYGRIGKALHRYLSAFTADITVCVRKPEAAALADALCADTCGFEDLKLNGDYDFIFNTVPHPVLGAAELNTVNKEAIILDLASFPGGVDKHLAKHKGIKLLIARGLPSLYSPKSAGRAVGKTVEKMIREGIL